VTPPGIDAELIGAVATATDALSAAQSQLDSATREYKATRASRDHANALARAAEKRAEAAKADATASAAQLLLKMRGTLDQTPGGPSAQILFDSGGGDLLQRLSALHQLGQLNATPAQLSARAARKADIAKKARSDADKAQAAANAISLTDARAKMQAAQTTVETAQTALDAAQASLQEASAEAAIPDFSGVLSDSTWVDPVRGPITDVYGPRPSRPLGTPLFHPGDDIGAACGTWIVAASSGMVTATGPNDGYGNWVVIDHGAGVQTVYGHIMDGGTAVTVGEHVTTGQPIAQVGSTGLSTGCHLHLEVRVNGQQIDPQPFFAARGVIVGS